jgi:hypothetical protein
MNRIRLAGIGAMLTFSTSANANLIGVDEIEIQSAIGVQVSEVIATEAGTGIDVALASNGGVATAFSVFDLASPADQLMEFTQLVTRTSIIPWVRAAMSFWT